MRLGVSAVTALTLVVTVACSGADDPDANEATGPIGSASPTEVGSSTPATVAPADSTATTIEAPASTATTTIATTTIATTTTTEPPQPFGDVAVIEPTTPTAGNDATPRLAWPSVDGAAAYTVLVADADGRAWWAWEGAESEVVFGGVADGPGALVIRPGTTWVVIAYDIDGGVLASSPTRRLDP